MAISEPPELVAFDAAAALETGRDVAGESFLSCTEYTRKEFNVLYVSDPVLSQYEDREHLESHFETLLSYFYIDFSERQLFEDELPAAGRVEFFLTRMDRGFMLRLITDAEGLLVYLAPDAPVEETADAMRSVMMDTDTASDSPYSVQ